MCVKLALTLPLSASVSVPLAFTSMTKFAAVTGCASWALTRPRSDSVTTRVWLTSPARNPIRTDPLPPVPPPAVLTSPTFSVRYWPLPTAVSGTISSLPLNVGAPTVAVPSLSAGVPPVTAESNVNTIVCAGPRRGSVVGLDGVGASGRSKVPATPCSLRADTLASAGVA